MTGMSQGIDSGARHSQSGSVQTGNALTSSALARLPNLKRLQVRPLPICTHTRLNIYRLLVQCCGKPTTRIPDVFDCWFESGSMPYAQLHYPFENKELFESGFPK